MNFANIAVLVLGDVMLDHYIVGSAQRVSPEAPVPVVSKERSWAVPGGAANVARGLARLGCDARLVGLVGNDAAGESLRRELAADGISAGLTVSASRPTICKTRIMAHGQQLLRVDEESIQPPALEERVALRLNFENLLEGCRAVILSDYAKGVLLRDGKGQSLCQDAIRLARDAGLPVLVDPKGIDWDRYAGASCVTPNMAEFAKVGESLGRFASLDLAGDSRARQLVAAELCGRFNLGMILLTRGARGMNLFVPGRPDLRIRATRREVADVSGAGDTVISTLAACVASGMDWGESARIANVAAGIAVGKIGTAPVNMRELAAALGRKESGAGPRDLPALLENIVEWRRQGDRIVFTNGCFDILHPGHVSLLQKSSELGDRLIVGLNSDASLRRLKGPARPIQDEKSRAAVLSALKAVDAVVLFGEDTPQKLIEAIRPDILVKGSDYSLENVVGADFVRGYGGQVRLVDIVEGFSTSGIVRRIQEGACPPS